MLNNKVGWSQSSRLLADCACPRLKQQSCCWKLTFSKPMQVVGLIHCIACRTWSGREEFAGGVHAAAVARLSTSSSEYSPDDKLKAGYKKVSKSHRGR